MFYKGKIEAYLTWGKIEKQLNMIVSGRNLFTRKRFGEELSSFLVYGNRKKSGVSLLIETTK